MSNFDENSNFIRSGKRDTWNYKLPPSALFFWYY